PDIIIPVDLKPYPSPVTDIDSDDMFPGEEEWMTKAEAFRQLLTLEPEVGHQLFEACAEAGYNYNTDGSLAYWLFDYLGKTLRDNPDAQINIDNLEKK
ncbi:hypothetical protein LRR18_17780, partial [Mangrovimonas sp. AS39]|uniref:hypothetical protein n=1 Tax=Mangrovimonas futianensis TaxID=2895523 RepID=UPI001E46FAD0